MENVIHLVFVEQEVDWGRSFLDRCPLPVIADLLRRESAQLTHLPFLLLPRQHAEVFTPVDAPR